MAFSEGTEKISGQRVDIQTPTLFRTGQMSLITAASGGQTLVSGTAAGAGSTAILLTVKNLSGNGVMMIGASGTGTAPFISGAGNLSSSIGFALQGEETITFEINNVTAIQICAVTSGQLVTWYAIDR